MYEVVAVSRLERVAHWACRRATSARHGIRRSMLRNSDRQPMGMLGRRRCRTGGLETSLLKAREMTLYEKELCAGLSSPGVARLSGHGRYVHTRLCMMAS